MLKFGGLSFIRVSMLKFGGLSFIRLTHTARRVLGVFTITCAVCGAPLGATASAAAARNSGYFVTFVARACPAYTDIFANRARNNILESLKDLGPNTQYGTSGRLVNPVDEGKPPQDLCRPLTGWQFTLGRSYRSRAVTGPWGSLSIATSVFQHAIVTRRFTPLLDQNAVQIGHDEIAGATTIELTGEERQQASATNRLWAQGGTPQDPVLAGTFPGPLYGFGALRCATDNLNGDNVEYIYFPAGVTHVFCYALYVSPSPTAGLITIKKQLTGAPVGDNPAFPFRGNISYDPNGFQLRSGQAIDFYRAGGATWSVTEGAVAGYQLTSVLCTAKTSAGTPGQSAATVVGGTASIALLAGEHVTCVYSNRYVPPAGGLELRKVTRDGTGRFTFEITPTSGGESRTVHAATTEPNVPVDAEPSLLTLAPGSYSVLERPTSSPDGHWRLAEVDCNGSVRSTTAPVQVSIQSGRNTTCTFTNAFAPTGSISLAKITSGATGRATFLITPSSGPGDQYLQHATTTEPGVAANALPNTAADATNHVPPGHYTIVEELPSSDLTSSWTLVSVLCNGVPVPFDEGVVDLTLTPGQPHQRCVFEDAFSAAPAPPVPPAIVPNPPAPPPVYELAELVLAKRASPTALTQGQVVTYRITARNLGPEPAESVELVDQPPGRGVVVGVHTPSGRCAVSSRIVCQLGTLRPGAQSIVTVQLRPSSPGLFTNRAVVGTATSERTLVDNVALATVRVLAPAPQAPPAPGLG
jgi:uncharacterized repeat protein (TIGR01451 family)